MKKYNNNSPYFKDWTIKKLKYEALGYDEMINRVGCCGTRDIIALNRILEELENRGVKYERVLTF